MVKFVGAHLLLTWEKRPVTMMFGGKQPSHPKRPRRLAWPRTSPFHGGNAGSNPAGDANKNKRLAGNPIFRRGHTGGTNFLARCLVLCVPQHCDHFPLRLTLGRCHRLRVNVIPTLLAAG